MQPGEYHRLTRQDAQITDVIPVTPVHQFPGKLGSRAARGMHHVSPAVAQEIHVIPFKATSRGDRGQGFPGRWQLQVQAEPEQLTSR